MAGACWKARSAPRRTCTPLPGCATLAWGCEHFGPQILVEDLVTEPLRFEDFHIHLPAGPGLGVRLDHDKLRHFARAD